MSCPLTSPPNRQQSRAELHSSSQCQMRNVLNRQQGAALPDALLGAAGSREDDAAQAQGGGNPG